jgi:Tol biopolymer transport system component
MIARIVGGAPDLDQLPSSVPPSIRLLLEATLNKNVHQRLQHIGDTKLFLDPKLVARPAPAVSTAGTEGKTSRGRLWMASFAAGVLVALIPAFLFLRSAPSPDAPEMQFELSPPGMLGMAGISPDGQRLAYLAQDEDGRALWIRPIGSGSPQKLMAAENLNGIFWSPDSRYLAVFSDGRLRKLEAATGATQVLSDIAQHRGFTWNRAGVILIGRVRENDIVRLAAAGGEPTPIVRPDANQKEIIHAVPIFLPDGNHFVYATLSSVPENSGIFVGSLDGKAPTRLMPLPNPLNNMAYASGYLLYSSNGLFAQRFDTDRLQLEGDPISIAPALAGGAFSVSDTGLLFYRPGAGGPPNRQLTWYDRGGRQIGHVGEARNYGTLELSPAGDRVAVDAITDNNRDIWVIDIARSVPSRITFDAANDWSPSWSSNGASIVFASSRSGANDIYQKASSGVGNDQLVYNNARNEVAVNVSPDGRYIVFSRPKEKGGNDTWIFDTVDKKETPFVESPFDKIHARLSPNGRWIAYSTNDSGMYQVVVQSLPDPNGGKWQITSQGGVEPKWRRDGRELYYLALDGKLMAVTVTSESTFTAGTPAVLFETPLTVNRSQPPRDRRYDVAPDGRFLLAVPVGSPLPTAITAVVNWTSRLMRE